MKSGGVVLIDEPELSLHVSWQRALLSTLISGDKHIQYLVATHSPMIVSEYGDRAVRIGLPGDGEDT
jgi:predicted ATP-binding protein involved in virulence